MSEIVGSRTSTDESGYVFERRNRWPAGVTVVPFRTKPATARSSSTLRKVGVTALSSASERSPSRSWSVLCRMSSGMGAFFGSLGAVAPTGRALQPAGPSL